MSKYLDWYKSTVGHTHMQDQAKSEIEQLREQLAKANERLNNPQGLQELVCFEHMKEIPLREIHRAHQRLHEELAKADVRVEELELVVIAITHADETGYVDGEGFVQGWNEVCDETKSLLNKFAIEKKIEGVSEWVEWCRVNPSHLGLTAFFEQLRKGQE
jgi:ABC-type Fe2+-enterobactin transport system substrate-binding protein